MYISMIVGCSRGAEVRCGSSARRVSGAKKRSF
jgi:hypothetical protein